jgi:UDP-glucose 4-epimerase
VTGKRIIVTGGAGYIGSHVCVELLNAGGRALVIDNFANSSPKALDRIAEIAGAGVELLNADLADASDTARIIDSVRAFKPDGAIHLAGLKAVGESVSEPVRYYSVNLPATFTLIRALEEANARMLVFSSSATVYGDLNPSPVDEAGAVGPTNPYGRTKLFIEEMLRDLARADKRWKIANLRYFNPVGAHSSGLIGEDPHGLPNNLFPFIAQVAVGRRPKLKIFGNDYPTRDGTGVRDYIHVMDLAEGHAAAVAWALRVPRAILTANLGTGRGHSVLDVVQAFARASGREIPYRVVARRPGDVAACWADPTLAQTTLNWRARRTLDEMCADAWRWQSQHPQGFA